ncbi:hypothetical protein GC170_15630 [bacterium]|nr:hypothetical protein [bacterium]
MPQSSATLPKDWFPRRRVSAPASERFVPIRSSVDAIRRIAGHLAGDNRVVVLYGPQGTGRSTIARRVGSLWSGPVSILDQPPSKYDPDVAFASQSRKLSSDRSRGVSLRVIDALTLDHADWSAHLAEELPPWQKALVVSSTAWWLEFGRYLPVRVSGVTTNWLDSDEIAHLINAIRWMRDPNAQAVDPDFVTKVADASEGRISEILRMAGMEPDRIR